MSSGRSEADLAVALRALVRDNADRIFDQEADQVRLERLDLGRARHRKQDRHHRVLNLRYSNGAEPREKRIWLKFVPSARSQYEIHMSVWNRTHPGYDLFPQPYFFEEWTRDDGVIGMELVEGASLRALFLRRALTRRTSALDSVFAALGRRLRAFHDGSQPAAFRPLEDLKRRVVELTSRTPYLTDDQRERARERIDSAVVRAGGDATTLPSIPIHHDCTLRNVVVRPGGSPCLLDLDSMVARWKSRWYDVAAFLINLESQIKYAPLADPAAIEAAWHSFWGGYTDGGPPDSLSLEEAYALLYLVKVEYLLGGTWLPLFEIYRGRLAARYLTRLRSSVLSGEVSILGAEPVVAA